MPFLCPNLRNVQMFTGCYSPQSHQTVISQAIPNTNLVNHIRLWYHNLYQIQISSITSDCDITIYTKYKSRQSDQTANITFYIESEFHRNPIRLQILYFTLYSMHQLLTKYCEYTMSSISNPETTPCIHFNLKLHAVHNEHCKEFLAYIIKSNHIEEFTQQYHEKKIRKKTSQD